MTGGPGAIDRLSAFDLTNLTVEAPDTPMHVGMVAVLDGRSLLDAGGRLDLAGIKARIAAGLDAAPKLRKKVYRPGPLAGRPLWVDDPVFAVERHVAQAAVDPPGGEDELLRLTEALMRTLLDRSRPLWQLWVVTGLPDQRLAVVVKLHHAVGDGVAAMRLIGALLDPPAGGPGVPPWAPVPPPRRRDLVVQRFQGRTGRRVRRTAGRPPLRRTLRGAWQILRQGWAAPRTSLNAPIGPGRRLGVVRLDLAEAKAVAHAAGGKVNDVLVTLAGGGLRGLLRSRGEPVDGVELRVAVAVSLRGTDRRSADGNHNGSFVIRLPLHGADPAERLRAVTAGTRRAKQDQPAVMQQHFMAVVARTGLARRLSRSQHLINFVESNVPGPPAPIRMLGAPVLDLVPVGAIAGNLTITFLAVSYAGRLVVSVLADRDRVPDLPVVVAGMAQEWAGLREHLGAAA
ncbi:wax ester/triacylglycerol synthase family O-acyltransferase [Dactylosporangium sp. NBC_01737]|uniref:wax ester/triacylglycerol synthase family O-acyltransferase n=1 Tax=Dactylosporangium sp. NBC_01737 TaxID=2975959 RepID=UPI002E11CE04|nr:wax ester/triacylglycerol synthase family O-acyltransferase [Dactylosporangium sp. NBC_01737]